MKTVSVILKDKEGETVDEFVNLEDISRLFKDSRILNMNPKQLEAHLRKHYIEHSYHGALFRLNNSYSEHKTMMIHQIKYSHID